MKDFYDILKKVQSTKYYDLTDLQYNLNANILLSNYELREFIKYKDQLAKENKWPFVKLDLKSFNSECIYFCNCEELISYIQGYYREIDRDLNESGTLIGNRMRNEMLTSRIYSEIEGSLNVESVPTTRRRLKELLENDIKPESRNDIIIKNMDAGIKFVMERPEFNKENLYKLYNILSNGCLDDDDKLRDGEYYRYDSVEVGNYHGCPADQIEDHMNSLFDFVNLNKLSDFKSLLPHICHYYILYVHPYFDYNGRTARMVSLWINLLIGQQNILPPVISEAINQTKKEYYQALENTRDSNNDITYFLIYIFKTYLNYYLCYRNLEFAKASAILNHSTLSDTELHYLKRILISNMKVFTSVDFIKMCNIDISKQGAFKILNKFVDLGILKQVKSATKKKLFEINEGQLPYTSSK